MVISKNLYRVISLLKCVTLKKYTLLYISLTISLKSLQSNISVKMCNLEKIYTAVYQSYYFTENAHFVF